MTSWSQWKAGVAFTTEPYVNWWEFTGGDDASAEQRQDQISLIDIRLPLWTALSSTKNGRRLSHVLGGIKDELKDLYASGLPVPVFAQNPVWRGDIYDPIPKVVTKRLPSIRRDSVIVGVVDSGISLGNYRTRFPDGKTRVIASWQQTTPMVISHFGKPVDGGSEVPIPYQAYLPFGRELYADGDIGEGTAQDGINQLLEAHSAGGLEGPLDEEAFNRAAGLVYPQHTLGARDLMGRTAHGTHVGDMAAGLDPATTDQDTLERLRMIHVTLPTRRVIGLSGTYLDPFIYLAILRITAIADATWVKNEGEEGPGYPIVINLSFGKQAGARDGSDLFERFLRKLNESRPGYRPVDVVLPVGNDNLKRAHAGYSLEQGGVKSLDFTVMPQDQSSNFLEVWSAPITSNGGALHDQSNPLAVSITPPGSARLDPTAGRPGYHVQFGYVARLYCSYHKGRDDAGNENGTYRVRYVFASAPSASVDGILPEAPAGAWRITVENCGRDVLPVTLSVQTDQSVLPGSSTGLRAHFDHPYYVLRNENTGRWVDSYAHCGAADTDLTPPIARHGTINSTATHSEAVAVAGYRNSDGLAADYSATGFDREMFVRSRLTPTVALPVDDSPALRGTFAAGGSNGSVVATAGTSFASAKATRTVAEMHLRGDIPDGVRAADALVRAAEAYERYASFECPVGNLPAAKYGAGRLPDTDHRRVRRRET